VKVAPIRTVAVDTSAETRTGTESTWSVSGRSTGAEELPPKSAAKARQRIAVPPASATRGSRTDQVMERASRSGSTTPFVAFQISPVGAMR
jgi:hypothetical protein